MRYATIALRLVLGAVFLYAAWLKLREPYLLFAMSIDSYQLLPQWAVLAVARTLPWAELVLGLGLVSGLWLRWFSGAAAALLLMFFGLMVRSYLKGMQIDCGCFGPGEALGPRTLLRDFALLAGALGLAVMSWRRRRSSVAKSVPVSQ